MKSAKAVSTSAALVINGIKAGKAEGELPLRRRSPVRKIDERRAGKVGKAHDDEGASGVNRTRPPLGAEMSESQS